MEDQEILLNLIERSKQSRKSRRKWRPAKVTVKERKAAPTEPPLVKNYVTKPPPSLRKPKQKLKNVAAEMKKIRQKRRKVKLSKPKPTKTRKKYSNNIEVSSVLPFDDHCQRSPWSYLIRCIGRNVWRELLRIFSTILCSERS